MFCECSHWSLHEIKKCVCDVCCFALFACIYRKLSEQQWNSLTQVHLTWPLLQNLFHMRMTEDAGGILSTRKIKGQNVAEETHKIIELLSHFLMWNKSNQEGNPSEQPGTGVFVFTVSFLFTSSPLWKINWDSYVPAVPVLSNPKGDFFQKDLSHSTIGLF